MISTIHVKQVSHAFKASGLVLDNISLQVPRGQFVALLGPSGCGKSTLLRFLAGFESSLAGEIEIRAERRGFVFQESTLLPWRTVLENVQLPLELLQQVQDMAKAEQWVRRVGLGDAQNHYPAQLSGGMKMRASLARALVTTPDLLLLDEPFAALDEEARNALQEDLYKLWQSTGQTVVFVTHSIAEAVFLAERVVVLTPRPARVLHDQTLALPKERTADLRTSVEFNACVRELQKMLHHKAGESTHA